jgi:hypothetical protein
MENSKLKTEIIGYVKKTALHTFIKPKTTFKWDKKESYYEYDYENGSYFRVWTSEEKNLISYLEDGKVKEIDIDNMIRWYGRNAKNVIKHQLFIDKKMRSIKRAKKVDIEIDEILKQSK